MHYRNSNKNICETLISKSLKTTFLSSSILFKSAVSLALALSFSGTVNAQVADGVQDTDFPDSYWAVDYYEGRDAIVGDSGNFARTAKNNGQVGTKSWLGERFEGVSSFNNLFQSNGSLPQMRWSQDETPLFPTKPSGFVPVTATFPDPGDPHYQIDFRRKFTADGILKIGGPGYSADDSVEIFIDGVRIFNERGTPPTENVNYTSDIPVSANSEVLIKYINLGFIGGYLFEANFVPDVNVISADDETVTVPVDGTMTQTNVVNVLDGDTLNFVQVVEADVTLTPVGTLPSGFTLNPNGTVDIAAGTSSGNYSFDYKVCESGVTPENCATATVTIPVALTFTPYVLAQPSNACQANFASWEFAPTGAAGDPAHAGTAFVDAGYAFDASGTPLYPSIPAPVTGTIDQTGNVQVPELTLNKAEPETYNLATRLEFTPNTTRTVVIRDERRFEHHIYELRASDGTVLAFEPEFYGGTAADKSYNVNVPADGVVYVYAWVVDFEQRNQTSFPVVCKHENNLVTTKTFGSTTDLGDGTFTMPITITAENQGNIALNNIQITDALSAASNFGSAFKSVTIAPSVSVTDTTGTPLIGTDVTAAAPSAASPAFDGMTNTNLFTGTDGALGVGDSLSVTFTVRLDANDASAPAILKNTASVSGVDPSGETQTDSTGGNASDEGFPTIFQRFMTADDETVATAVNAATAQTGVVNVLDGDKLNAATINSDDVTLSSADIPTGFTLNDDGSIDIAAGTADGDYSFTYKVCEDGVTPENCATATVEITIDTPTADLSITKTNTPGVNGEVDQTDDTVTTGDNTTYTLVVKNNGPDSVTGAVVKDTPTSGLTCADTDEVTLTGDGVPTGTFTIADLTGAGITLDTLTDGQSTTLTFSCEVN